MNFINDAANRKGLGQNLEVHSGFHQETSNFTNKKENKSAITPLCVENVRISI